MAITTNLLVTSNTIKLNGVSFFPSFPGTLNHCLARRLPQSMTTRRVQTSCCYRETSLKPVSPFNMSETEPSSVSDGVGILRFLKGKNYLLTGATGFLAKVLIEKLLRASPEIGKIFLLIKSDDQESANKRLYDELIPVVGDIGEDNLGIKSQIACKKISDEINVIINCAGRTTFDDRYDFALSVNTLGPEADLLFIAYVTGKREGTILETPLCIGENITPELNIETEMKLASEAKRKFYGREKSKKLKELGMERAQHYGWENTYTFTKAMGESVIHNQRGDLPVLVSMLDETLNEK
ncbi:unnamed protein product [Eruca vesicaria subsp. sativa]|uniref:Fatty acyl-CoA reductase n=1 Tax=Eruca vesicaria subsp. sativa TaxID=29727 RepID=A0ABC8KNF5_ERUVS|nr:unnamed protein product [Eruca vesicaria subsp. sativa]